ncbi:MAG TPA: hypothetical protein VML75_10110, partial [Kofleriaceae bacterium]|nr:hypothetical protein [Kofleriaceae bacterium]
DVYSLGAILFELITLQPLHPRVSASALLASTLQGVEARPSIRCPDGDIGPELEAMCVRATALEAADRFASAGALIAELERYLDGDRDLARRRELAVEYARTAEAESSGTLDMDARKRALRAAGRAVALDPGCVPALRVITRLMVEPPTESPPEVEAAMIASQDATSRHEAAGGVYTYLAYFLASLCLLLVGIKSWPFFVSMLVLTALHAWGAYAFSRARVLKPWHVLAATVGNTALLFVAARLYGPYVMIPELAMVSTIAFLFHSRLQRPAVTIGLGVLPVVGTVVLEALHVLPATYHLTGGALVIQSTAVDMPAVGTSVILLGMSLGTILVAGLYIHHLRAQLVDSERAVQLQAWQLRQMIPDEREPA